MDNRIKELIVGYDLCDDYIQISCFNQKTEDMDTICYIGSKMMERVPAVLCRLKDGSWEFGYDAWNAANAGRGTLVEHFVAGLAKPHSGTKVDGKKYRNSELVCIYIQKSMEMLTKYYPHWSIGHLTVTVEQLMPHMPKALASLAQRLSFEEDKMTVISHVTAYEYYALNQKKELWQHDVGLFDYSKHGLKYYHLNISRKRMPVAVTAKTTDLSEYMDGSEIDSADDKEKDQKFMEAVRKVTTGETISTVYLTGEGFEGEWLSNSLRILCHHRKAFIGSNIFSRGACFNSMTQAGKISRDNFMALNEDVLSQNMYLTCTKNHEAVNDELIHFGELWYEAGGSVVVIPRDYLQITVWLSDYVTREEKAVSIPLNPSWYEADRPLMTTRLKVSAVFSTPRTCEIEIKDLGFGDFYPAAEGVVKKTINIDDALEDPDDFKNCQRAIACDEKLNTIPYYFRLSGVKIYSLEELCYHIGTNIYAVNQETFNEDLIYWIDKNIGHKLLVKHLAEAKKADKSVKDLVRILINDADYYDKEQITEILRTLDKIASQNPMEAKKIEADNYLRFKRPAEALNAYQKVEEMMLAENSQAAEQFRASIWHNMGVAHAKMLNWESALSCFKRAYASYAAPESATAILGTLKVLNREDEAKKMLGELMLSPEDVQRVDDEIAKAEKKYEESDVSKMIGRIRRIKNERQWEEIRPDVTQWLEKQKKIYRYN